MASGVRSSCAALAVNWRCTAKPCSRRSSARFTAPTSGAISRGNPAVGNRTEVLAGPIEAATCDASRTGRSAPRIASTATARTSSMNSGMTQAMSKTNSSRKEWTSAVAPAARATQIDSGPAALSTVSPSP